MMQQMNQYKPPRYLVLSLLTLIVFYFPLGLAALVCALKISGQLHYCINYYVTAT